MKNSTAKKAPPEKKLRAIILFAIMLSIFLAGSAFAQAPAAFNYQAVARNAGGDIISNTTVGVQFQLHQTTSVGTVVYAETQTSITNALGVFSVQVGNGTPSIGTLSAVDWRVGPFYLEVGLDPAGGSSYVSMGTEQLLSVPYSLASGGNGLWQANDANIHNPNSGRIGVGTTTPGTVANTTAKIEIADEDGLNSDLLIRSAGSGTPGITLAKQNGTLAAPLAVDPDAGVGVIDAMYYNGSSYGSSSRILMQADGATNGTDNPGAISLQTTPAGSTNPLNRMMITSSGFVGIGTISPLKPLDVNGDALINGLTIGRGNGDVSSNSALGNQALFANTSGSSNTATGTGTLFTNTEGYSNTAIGKDALNQNTTAYQNTADGAFALNLNTGGVNNTATGAYALYSNTIGSENTAIGTFALNYNVEGFNNTAIGAYSLQENISGSSNTAIGTGAQTNNTTGYGNSTNGAFSLHSNTSGSNNTASGRESLYSNTEGINNTASGVNAMRGNITGNWNVALGSEALFSNDLSGASTAVGTRALYSANGTDENTAFGYEAGYSTTWGIHNVAVGAEALRLNTGGSNNTAVGFQALDNNSSGNFNTAIGYQARTISTSLTNATAIGYNAQVGVNNALVLGGTGIDSVNVGIGTTIPSEFALLDVKSTDQGFLPPRMSDAERDAIPDPVAGLVIFCTTTNELNVYNGYTWRTTQGITASEVIEVNIPAIGQPFQGGIVAYILQPGDPFYNPTIQRGIIAAPFDQSSAIGWGCVNANYFGFDYIGSGRKNTQKVIGWCNEPNYAAKLCADLQLNGYDDWHLPSRDELQKVLENSDLIGGFDVPIFWGLSGGTYWSSSEPGAEGDIPHRQSSGGGGFFDGVFDFTRSSMGAVWDWLPLTACVPIGVTENGEAVSGLDHIDWADCGIDVVSLSLAPLTGGSSYALKAAHKVEKAYSLYGDVLLFESVATNAVGATSNPYVLYSYTVTKSARVGGVYKIDGSPPVVSDTSVASWGGKNVNNKVRAVRYFNWPTGDPCSDGFQNGDETGVDCGGDFCQPCICSDNYVLLQLILDDNPEETSWIISDSTGAVFATSEGNYGSYASNDTIYVELCLLDGCYNFTMLDTQGDGLSTTGSYTLSNGVCRLYASGGPFGASETTSFCLERALGNCYDGIQNRDEECVDCGGSYCDPCPGCNDGILNGDEELIDCGGSCIPCHCYDYIQNGDETGVDCGGSCPPCETRCNDGIQNGDENDVDCGGSSCEDCHCSDGIHNYNEQLVDCGSVCNSTCILQDVLDAGQTPWDIYQAGYPADSLYGLTYKGGLIFYFDPQTGNGLVAAPEDQSTNAFWGCSGTTIPGADGTITGSGIQNTLDITSACADPGIAARLCDELVVNGRNDWFLPSKNELDLMWSNLADSDGSGSTTGTFDPYNLGQFASAGYWTSTEVSSTKAWLQHFGDGNQINTVGKSTPLFVRAARAFCYDCCDDGILNGDEEYVDCGGSCVDCETLCSDGIQNGDETGIDCGGSAYCSTWCGNLCYDGIMNGDETGVDCGGSCGGTEPVLCADFCDDGILNGDETGIDCGGSCIPCANLCSDGIQNGDETGIDCGGSCVDCAFYCSDGILNGDEVYVDCGGSSCDPCTVQGRLVGGETPMQIYQTDNTLLDSLYGKSYQGGLIFYFNTSNGTGMLAAPADHSAYVEWGCNGTLIPGADGSDIGSGVQNTMEITTACATPGIAARICNDLVLDGYGDWFLPSKDELNQMWLKLAANNLGGFVFNYYWSSTEVNINSAWKQDLGDGYQNPVSGKNEMISLRAARAFESCFDGIQNGDETDVDCGGSCNQCTALCNDGIQNGYETAVDCGGVYCIDCATLCSDGIQNGDETGVDCGGSSCVDCATLCSDGIQNGDETGVDCGGTSCVSCSSLCSDGIQNGDETGVDCGGSCVGCNTFCNDGIQNGNETGVDCGGPSCYSCADLCSNGIMDGDETSVDCGGTSCVPCYCSDGIKNNDEEMIDCGGSCYPCMYQDLLDSGQTAWQLYQAGAPLDSLYGLRYQGGLIFYLDTVDGSGMIAAPTDQGSTSKWGCVGIDIPGDTSIGAGAQNTLDITNVCADPGIAARLCGDLVLNGSKDWFLPSRDELAEMYAKLHLNGNGGFAATTYWSSTEFNGSDNYVWSQDFAGGLMEGYFKGDARHVRAARAFCVSCCSDLVQNGDEAGVDCGGAFCDDCSTFCNDGILNGDETSVDCGGSCGTCTVQYRLDNGETPYQIYQSDPALEHALYGKYYQGGLICDFSPGSGEGWIVAAADLPAAKWVDGACYYFEFLLEEENASQSINHTNFITTTCGTPNCAGKICANLALNGYNDWYLPSIGLMYQIWWNLADTAHDDINYGPSDPDNIGGLANGMYWTSNAHLGSSTDADGFWMGAGGVPDGDGGFYQGGVPYFLDRQAEHLIRPVRPFQAYANCSDGTQNGDETGVDCGGSCITPCPIPPTLTTNSVSSIGNDMASGGGNISSSGDLAVTARGVCWSTVHNPTTSYGFTISGSGTGSYASSLTGLIPGTTYYVRAFATTGAGTTYGNEVSFTTSIPVIGEFFQGGKVAYILQAGDPGYVAGQTHGFIAQTSDITPGIAWGCSGSVTDAGGTAIGTGAQNTAVIIGNTCSINGAAFVTQYNIGWVYANGYTDWFLPSMDELQMMYPNRAAIGQFAGTKYWSSSEIDFNTAFSVSYVNGSVSFSPKTDGWRVRAIRYF